MTRIAASDAHRDARLIARAALGVTVARVMVACVIGPGDAEALYALYAHHLQLGYLDHAPLVGWLQRLAETLGPTELGLALPLPHGLELRLVPMLCWVVSLAATCDLARTLHPDRPRAALVAGLAFVACPLFLVGGLAATPDGPMSAAWLGALALAARAFAAPRSAAAGWQLAAAGALVGVATLAKYSGALLGVGLLVALAGRDAAPLRRRAGTWLGLGLGLFVASPPLVWNVAHDWASVRHRLLWSQGEAGFSVRNVGALLGGQLAYLTPLVAFVGLALLARLWRARTTGPPYGLLATTTWVALGPLVLLCSWSRVAEPHWLLPIWLPLPATLPAVLPRPGPWEEEAIVSWALRPRFLRLAAWSGLGLVVLLHVHVLTDLAPRLLPAAVYDPRFDLAHDLRGWSEVASRVEQLAAMRRTNVVLGPHWTTCAQLELALRARRSRLQVGCLTGEIDDYDWWSPSLPARRPAIFVEDGRWNADPGRRAPAGSALERTVELERGGRVVRRFDLWSLAGDAVRNESRLDTSRRGP